MGVVFRKNGQVTHGNGVFGTWDRVYSGKVDRGVRLGDWVGELSDGTPSPQFQQKQQLVNWFVAQICKLDAAKAPNQ